MALQKVPWQYELAGTKPSALEKIQRSVETVFKKLETESLVESEEFDTRKERLGGKNPCLCHRL